MIDLLKKIGKKIILSKVDGSVSRAKVAGLIAAGAGLVGAALVASGVSPELSQAIEDFINAIGELYTN